MYVPALTSRSTPKNNCFSCRRRRRHGGQQGRGTGRGLLIAGVQSRAGLQVGGRAEGAQRMHWAPGAAALVRMEGATPARAHAPPAAAGFVHSARSAHWLSALLALLISARGNGACGRACGRAGGRAHQLCLRHFRHCPAGGRTTALLQPPAAPAPALVGHVHDKVGGVHLKCHVQPCARPGRGQQGRAQLVARLLGEEILKAQRGLEPPACPNSASQQPRSPGGRAEGTQARQQHRGPPHSLLAAPFMCTACCALSRPAKQQAACTHTLFCQGAGIRMR